MKRKPISIMLVAAGLVMLMVGGVAVLAAESATQNLKFNIPVVSSLTLDGADVNFGEITQGTPSEAKNAATVTGESNASWSITLSGTKFTNGTNDLLLDDIFQVKVDDGAYSNIVDGKALIPSIDNSPGAQTFAMDYKLNVPVSAKGNAGDYTASLTYTIFVY